MLALRQLGAAYPEPTKTVWVRRPSLLELNGAYISKRVKNSKHADMRENAQRLNCDKKSVSAGFTQLVAVFQGVKNENDLTHILGLVSDAIEV